MTQLDLFDWQPPRAVVAFPHARRGDLIRQIVVVFVRDGYDAGNRVAMGAGCSLIADLYHLCYSEDEIGRALDRFIATWRAASIGALLCQRPTDEHAA